VKISFVSTGVGRTPISFHASIQLLISGSRIFMPLSSSGKSPFRFDVVRFRAPRRWTSRMAVFFFSAILAVIRLSSGPPHDLNKMSSPETT